MKIIKDIWGTIYHGDVSDAMAMIADETVHCVITSPPYDDLRTYGGKPTDWGPSADK